MGRGPHFTNEQLVAALHATRGSCARAAEQLGCCTDTIERRVRKNKGMKDLVFHYQELRLDKAISKLEEAIDVGKPWAIQLEIKMRGHRRGYVDRQEITGADGTPVGHVPGPDIGNMDDEQFRIYLAGLAEAARIIASK